VALRVDTSRVSVGETIAGGSAVALFVFMFFPWFGAKVSGTDPGVGTRSVYHGNVSAWGAFGFIDILLLLVVLVVVGLVLAKASGSLPELPQSMGSIILGAGGFATFFILLRLLSPPDPDLVGFVVNVDATRKIGIFLGLIAAAGITFGGWTAVNESPPR
jgi:hypothetical protein